MATYDVIRKSDSASVYRYSAADRIEWAGFEFATHDHVEVDVPSVEAPVEPIRITEYAFMQRFTTEERIALELQMLDNPSAGFEVRTKAAALRVYLQDIRAAQFIDLGYPKTREGVMWLEAEGLLASGRATAILDTPPTQDEIY